MTDQATWKGWLTMEALVRSEERFDKLSGGAGMVTPVFQLALGKPRSYGGSLLHLIRDEVAACGAHTPPLDDAGGSVAFYTNEGDGIPKCKRCLKKEVTNG